MYYCGSAQPERAARALPQPCPDCPGRGALDPECEVRLHAGPEPQLVEEHMDVSQGKLALASAPAASPAGRRSILPW